MKILMHPMPSLSKSSGRCNGSSLLSLNFDDWNLVGSWPGYMYNSNRALGLMADCWMGSGRLIMLNFLIMGLLLLDPAFTLSGSMRFSVNWNGADGHMCVNLSNGFILVVDWWIGNFMAILTCYCSKDMLLLILSDPPIDWGDHLSARWCFFFKTCNVLSYGFNLSSLFKKAVRAKIEESGCSIFCLQETKVQDVDCSFIKKIVPKRFSKFSHVPSLGAFGGILMGWNDSVLKGEVLWNQDFAITVAFTSRHIEQKWKLTTVYGPCHGERRNQFVQWLFDLQIDIKENWMLVGDFNFYRSSEDRNRGGNYNDMEIFNSIISHHGQMEIHLKGREFTWSNMQENPLLEQLDWCFTSPGLPPTLVPSCYH
jgi:exonuclease III